MSGKGKKRKNRPPTAGGVGRSEGIRPGQVPAATPNDEEPQDPQRIAMAFERELVWCIQQLEFGLTSGRTKPEGRQAEEALKILKILQNPKAPVIKKRQVMRNTFGDYRKKMAEEVRKHASSMKKMKLEPVQGDKKVKAKFLKRASGTPDSTPGGATPTGDVTSSAGSGDVTSLMSKLSFQGNDSGFKFNFNTEEKDGQKNEAEADQQTDNGEKQTGEYVPAPCKNYFKMNTSDNSFRFDFSAPESS